MAENYRFDASSKMEDIHASIEENGCAIVENLLGKEDLAELNAQIAPQLAKTSAEHAGAFMGQRTLRFGALMYTVPKTHDLVRHPVVLAMLDRTIGVHWRYKLSFSGVMHVMEGQAPQVLHRDNAPDEVAEPTLCLATMWAAQDFRKENGATIFVPGSHKWSYGRRAQRHELRVAEMPAGSILFYKQSVIHGAGRCKQGFRTGVSLQYSASWMQWDENQSDGIPVEYRKTLDEDLLKLIGFDLIGRNWGTVGQAHPLDYAKQDGRVRPLDPPGYELANGKFRSLKISLGPVLAEDTLQHCSVDDE